MLVSQNELTLSCYIKSLFFFFLVSFQKIDFLGLKKKKIWPLIAGYGLSVGRELQGETFLAEIVSFEEFLGA